MPTLTRKNIPDDLYDRLKEAARLRHRSMNSEIICCVEQVLCSRPVDVSGRLATARKLRTLTAERILSDRQLTDAKANGRP